MAAPDDLEARVGTLETQVRELIQRVSRSEQDAAAAGQQQIVALLNTRISQQDEQSSE